MDAPTENSAPKKHVRHPSSGRALPRRPTRGPLDIADAPITTSSSTPTSPPPLIAQPSSLLSPTTSQYATPRLPSPGPGSNLSLLSSPSFKTARSSLSPSRSAITTKDFSSLLRPELYHPLSSLDVPPPFRLSSSVIPASTSLPELLASGNFRLAAIKAAQELTSPDLTPKDHERIFELLYARLSALTLCGHTTLAAQEVKGLEDLNSSVYRDEVTKKHVVPWELRVLAVRLQGVGFGDARRGVVGFFELVREVRMTLTGLKKTRKANENSILDEGVKEGLEGEIQMWEQRLADLGILIASALIEMDDLEGATRFLASLTPFTSSPTSPSSTYRNLEMQKALLWLCIGDVDAARACISSSSTTTSSSEDNKEPASETQIILALAHMADADFAAAVEIWKGLIERASEGGEEAMLKQNLAVCYLYLGRMDEARETMETLIEGGNAFHALTFNLSTIYELCTERSRVLKIGLAERVAQGQAGWEGGNGDFKL